MFLYFFSPVLAFICFHRGRFYLIRLSFKKAKPNDFCFLPTPQSPPQRGFLKSPLERGRGVLRQSYTPLYPLFLEGNYKRLKFLNVNSTPLFPLYKEGLGCGYATLGIIFIRAYLCKFAAYYLEAALSRMASTSPGMV